MRLDNISGRAFDVADDLEIEGIRADFSHARSQGLVYRAGKRAFDILVSLLLLPFVVLAAAVLWLINRRYNPGPLFYVQPRMGRDCKAFAAIKFRTMLPAARITRGADDPVETHRITRLGGLLRKTRIDELPQVFNVLRGEMSLIGPRPDYFHHARKYMRQVPGYRARHRVRPGISGLAQTELGYANGIEATRAKVRADIYYIENASFRLDTFILYRTVITVLGCRGS